MPTSTPSAPPADIAPTIFAGDNSIPQDRASGQLQIPTRTRPITSSLQLRLAQLSTPLRRGPHSFLLSFWRSSSTRPSSGGGFSLGTFLISWTREISLRSHRFFPGTPDVDKGMASRTVASSRLVHYLGDAFESRWKEGAIWLWRWLFSFFFCPSLMRDHQVLLDLRVVENSGSGSRCVHERYSRLDCWGFCAICFGKVSIILA